MNWLKKLLNGVLNSFKDDVNREIDRAIGDLRSGKAVNFVVNTLHQQLAAILAKAKLPVPLGAILASMLMMVVKLTFVPPTVMTSRCQKPKPSPLGRRLPAVMLVLGVISAACGALGSWRMRW